ncbi:dethiobiotin synthase [Salinactinospora qingdaonensis]|uniref:ATP-dependent dethiobiotin synthetase BioD n=1 Tax=Salinactinospora qingdaonensis TaxID=702744 RepID=A0ABP7EVI4_9ACTN
MSVLVVTGTGTDVGKTAVTAAIAAAHIAHGERVAVLKPAQTGAAGHAPGDIDEIVRLVPGVTGCELARYPEPLAPEAAARRSGLGEVSCALAARVVAELVRHYDLVLVEGAGGLLVRMAGDGTTLADLASAVAAPVLIVSSAGLGTLNATALTAEALRSRGLACLGVVIGQWPATPGTAELCNLTDLPVIAGAPVLGALPEGITGHPPARFAAWATAGLAPSLGGTFEHTAFTQQHTSWGAVRS